MKKIKKGKLQILDFNGNQTFYVQFKDGEIPLHSNLIDKLGFDKLEKMNGKLFKWEISVWNHLTSQLSGKYRVTDLVK